MAVFWLTPHGGFLTNDTAPVESDLPQSRPEDDVETWLAELKRKRIKSGLLAPRTLEEQDIIDAMFQLKPKNPLSVNPVFQWTQNPPNSSEPINTLISAAQCQINGSTNGLPEPQYQDDDEDSSPRVQELDQEEPYLCSNLKMTTSGHASTDTLTHFGFQMATMLSEPTRKGW